MGGVPFPPRDSSQDNFSDACCNERAFSPFPIPFAAANCNFVVMLQFSREKNPPLSLARTVGIFGHFPRYLIHSGVAVLLCSVSFTFSLSLSLSPTFYRAMRKSHSHATSSFHTATDHGPLRYPTRYPDVYDAPTGLIVFFARSFQLLLFFLPAKD